MSDPSPSTGEAGYLSLAGARTLLEAGETTSVELVETLLRRVAEIDRAGPEIRSVLATCPEAVTVAAMLDESRRRGELSGPLHGIPVLVKDNIDTAGEEGTTAGSLALAMTRPARDAVVVERLRAAGAIVLAKANLSEWANFRGERSSSGWSAVGGQCRNPHALSRSPGGSSAGSGAGVAAGLAPLSVGTETDGSILCPAALNGVVGIKPTVGLTSRTGVVPISASQDTVGPLARSVADAASLLGVLAGSGAGADPADAATLGRPAGLPSDYSVFCSADGLAGARIGIPREHYFGYSPKADALVDAALGVAREGGAELVDHAEIPNTKELADSDDEITVLLHEYAAGLNAYLASRPSQDGQPRTVEEVVAFNEAHADRELAFFGQELLVRAAATTGIEDPSYLEARARNWKRAREDGIDAALAGSRVDVLAVPTMGPAWCIDHVNGDAVSGACYKAAAVAGYPSISIPVGLVAGLPVGLTLIGTAWSEPVLIRVAYALERALDLGAGMRPQFRSVAL